MKVNRPNTKDIQSVKLPACFLHSLRINLCLSTLWLGPHYLPTFLAASPNTLSFHYSYLRKDYIMSISIHTSFKTPSLDAISFIVFHCFPFLVKFLKRSVYICCFTSFLPVFWALSKQTFSSATDWNCSSPGHQSPSHFQSWQAKLSCHLELTASFDIVRCSVMLGPLSSFGAWNTNFSCSSSSLLHLLATPPVQVPCLIWTVLTCTSWSA